MFLKTVVVAVSSFGCSTLVDAAKPRCLAADGAATGLGALWIRLPESVGVLLRPWARYSPTAPLTFPGPELARAVLALLLVADADTACFLPAAVPVCCPGVAGAAAGLGNAWAAWPPCTTISAAIATNAVALNETGARRTDTHKRPTVVAPAMSNIQLQTAGSSISGTTDRDIHISRAIGIKVRYCAPKVDQRMETSWVFYE